MKKRILAAVFAFAAAGSAQAVDYTLNVPVNVTNLTPGASLTLNCRLCEVTGQCRQAPSNQKGAEHEVVARASKPVPLANGNYSGTLTVVFNLSDAQVGRAARYKCELLDGPGVSAVLPSTLIKPNSNSVTSVEGNVQ